MGTIKKTRGSERNQKARKAKGKTRNERSKKMTTRGGGGETKVAGKKNGKPALGKGQGGRN